MKKNKSFPQNTTRAILLLIISGIGLIVSFVSFFGIYALYFGVFSLVSAASFWYVQQVNRQQKRILLLTLIISVATIFMSVFQYNRQKEAIEEIDLQNTLAK